MHGVLEASVRCHGVASCWSLAVAPAAYAAARHASDEDELDGIGNAAGGKIQSSSAKSDPNSTADASPAALSRTFATLARSAVVATGSSSSAAGKALCVDAFQHIKLPPTAVPL